MKTYFLEDTLEMTGYRLSELDQVDDYGQDKLWKMQKQMQRSRKNPVVALAEVSAKVILWDYNDGVNY